MKTCSKCGSVKSLDSFTRRGPSGRYSHCKRCHAAGKRTARKAAPAQVITDAATRYYKEGQPLGLTIAEWEHKEGLPLFTVWPEAEAARDVGDPGWFLYCTASDEERARMHDGRGSWSPRKHVCTSSTTYSLPAT